MAEDEKKEEKKNQLVIRETSEASLWKPEILLPEKFDEARRKHHSREVDGTYSDYVGKYSGVVQVSSENALVLSRSSTAIMAMHRADSLELARKEMGLDNYRERLIHDIYDNISFEEGVQKILSYINKRRDLLARNGIEMAKKIEDIGRVMPEITAAEIAWTSTVQGVPAVYAQRFGGVPTILDFDVEGIDFGFDGLNAFDLQCEFSKDPFEAAGFTGVNKGAEFHPYTGQFQRAFRALALLILSDSFIYQKLSEENSDDSLIKGDGKFKRALVEKNPGEYGLTEEQVRNTRLGDLPIKHRQFAEMEERIGKILSNKHVYDLGRDFLCYPQELVRIVGMLEKVPEVLLREEEFAGYILPFGKGVKILDKDGKEIEYVPYELYLQLMAQQGLYHYTRDISRKNNLLTFVFDSYAQGIEAQVGENDALPLDRVRSRFRQKNGISIPARSIKSFRTEDSPFAQSIRRLKDADTRIFAYTLKMGLFELESLWDTVAKLPRCLAPEIKSIKREFAHSSSEDMVLSGLFTFGRYFFGTKEIVLYSPEDEPFYKASAVERQIYKNALAHEMGHGVWEGLNDETKSCWGKISRINQRGEVTDEFKGAFIYDVELLRFAYSSDYTGEDSMIDSEGWIEEDFCEHFAAYLNHGKEFRENASQNPGLKEKYDYLKILFEKYVEEGESTEYSDQPLVTLEDQRKHRRHLLKRKTIEEAVIEQGKFSRTRERKSREIREAVVPSLEKVTGDDDSNVHQHIYRRRNPEHVYVLKEILGYLPGRADITRIGPRRFVSLLEQSPEKAARYLTKRFRYLDPEETLDFAKELRDSLYDFRKEGTRPVDII